MTGRVLGALILGVFVASAHSGEMTGTVSSAIDQKPVQGHPVRLRIYQGEREVSGAEVFTAANGRFRFKDLKTDGYAYVLAIDYFGVPYFQGPYRFKEKESLIAADPVLVYPSTTTLEDISIIESVLIEVGRSDVLKIHQTIQIQNDGEKAYSPYREDSEKISFPLAKGGFNLEFSDFTQNLFEVDGQNSALVLKAPIYPTQGAGYKVKFSYLLPYASKTQALDFTSNAAMKSFHVVVNRDHVRVEAPGLQRGTDLPYQGGSSQVYSTENKIAAKAPLQITLRGLPRLTDRYHAGLAIGFLVVLALLVYAAKSASKSAHPSKERLIEDALFGLAGLEKAKSENKISESDYAFESGRLREILFELKRTPSEA